MSNRTCYSHGSVQVFTVCLIRGSLVLLCNHFLATSIEYLHSCFVQFSLCKGQEAKKVDDSTVHGIVMIYE